MKRIFTLLGIGLMSFYGQSQTLDQTINTVDFSAVCSIDTTIELASSEVGVDYYLRDNADSSIISGPVAGTGGAISLNTGIISATTTFNIVGEVQETKNALRFIGNSTTKVVIDTNLWANNYYGNNQLTVEAWINRSATGSFYTIVSNYEGSYPFLLRIQSDKLVLLMNSSGIVTSTSTIPLGVWTHVAATYDGVNANIYINGALEGSVPYSSNYINTTTQMKIGGGLANGTEYFTGDIADVRFWNTARTQADISANKNLELTGNEPGLVALYNFNEGSGTTTASLPSNTYPGTLVHSPAWVTGPTEPVITQMSQLVTITINSIANQTVAITDTTLCMTNTGTTVTTPSSEIGVTYYLRDNTNDTIVDGPIIGTGSGLTFNTGILNNDMIYNVYSEVVNNALSFDGSDDYVVLSNESNFDFTTNMTVEFWMNTTNLQSLDGLVTKGDNSWRIHGGNTSGRIMFAGSGAFADFESTTSVDDGLWHHVAVTYDGANAKIYIDGVMENSVAATAPINNGNYAVTLGNNLQHLSRAFQGDMDEVRIWNVAKTSAEINADMNTTLNGNEAGLVSYFNFNQGIANGNNSSITTLNDNSVNGNNGQLTNFALIGSASNWVDNSSCSLQLTPTVLVTIHDIVAPVADNATLSDLTDECSVSMPTAPTATDNCSGAITGTTTTTFPITTQGTTVVTWTYDDGNGNTSTQTQNVVITDVTAPVADIATLTDVTATCEVTSLTDPTATDNCSGTVTVTNDATLPINTIGTTVVTWTYDDGNGNTSTQTQNVIVSSPSIDVTTTTTDLTITANNTTATAYQWLDCNNNNMPISGETSASYTATVNGDYAVIVTEGNCSDTSSCVAITTVGVDELTDLGVSIYPNPNNGTFTISTTSNNVYITVYSVDGKTIINHLPITQTNQTIQLEGVESGVYFVNVVNDTNQKTIRLVVE